MKDKGPCTVCGQATRKLLFNDNGLHILMCSYECKNRYLDALSDKEEANLLRRLDDRIEQTKHRLKLSWATAGAGVLTLAVGLFTRNAAMFLGGASMAAVCAFLTRYFEENVLRVRQNRRSVSV